MRLLRLSGPQEKRLHSALDTARSELGYRLEDRLGEETESLVTTEIADIRALVDELRAQTTDEPVHVVMWVVDGVPNCQVFATKEFAERTFPRHVRGEHVMTLVESLVAG